MSLFSSTDFLAAKVERLLNSLVERTISYEEAVTLATEIQELTDKEIHLEEIVTDHPSTMFIHRVRIRDGRHAKSPSELGPDCEG